MKISEIIDIKNNSQDMVDFIKLSTLPTIDRFIDNIFDISNNFNTPVEFLNQEMVSEMLVDSIETRAILVDVFDDNSKWVFKINQIIHYLSNS